MPGPGEYLPDPTEGITCIEDLPQPKIRKRSRNYRRRPCPRCGHSAYRDPSLSTHPPRPGRSRLRSSLRPHPELLAALLHGLSQVLQRRRDRPGRTGQSLHPTGRRHGGPPGRRGRLAVSGRQLAPLARPPRLRPLAPRSRTGSRPGGKRRQRRIDAEHLDWALADFSGYIAADELYDGPFCVLSLVDNRTFKRITYQVLDHDPTQDDITAFFRRFQAALQQRGLTLRGITTDGSPLYPVPIAEVFGAVPHQVCTFHVLARVDQGGARRRGQGPQGPGRPEAQAAREAVPPKRPERRPARSSGSSRRSPICSSTATCSSGTTLSPSERRTLLRISRGLPQLRTLRAIMDEVYRLFDRRCRTDTALDKLAQLAASRPSIPPGGPDTLEAVLAEPGEGVDVPG